MADKTEMPVAPPLPAGCVDFNSLHAAALAGEQPGVALQAALIVPEAEQAPQGDPSEPAAPAEPRVPQFGDAVELTEKGGGYWTISAPWLPEPESVRGGEAARTRQGELQALVPTTAPDAVVSE